MQPTWAAISREGLAQYTITCDTLGLFARSIVDLQLLASSFNLRDDEPVPPTPSRISGAKIGFCKTHVWPRAGPGTREAWEKAKALLGDRGAVVEDFELPEEFARALARHGTVVAGEEAASFLGI